MNKKNERNMNITIVNPEESESDVVVSFSTILRKLKKYLLVWIVAAVVAFATAFGYAGITTHIKKPTLEALISFSWTGITKGLDPAGKKFDPYIIKDPSIIEEALTDLDMDLELIEPIRKNIKLEGIRPKDAADRIALYDSILSQNNASIAVDKILETSYVPTQYYVYFDYNDTDLSSTDAVDLFNAILNGFNKYFYKTYGYNESLGSAVTAINYEDYDYSEAIDVFSTSLSTLSRYVKQLANEDTTQFRSSVTGYTFNDLYQAVNTIRDIDLDICTSYINVNNITKDKDAALAYCEYRIKSLNRSKSQYEEELQAYNSAIENYVKDDIIIFGGNAGDDSTTQTKVASAQYDKMFNERNTITNSLASTKQRINYYKERQESIRSTTVGSTDKVKKVESQLAALSTKIDELVELVSLTADDYYVNVTFRNAYNVLVPASNTAVDRVARIINNAKLPFILLEGLCIMIYFAVSFIEAVSEDSRKKKAVLASGAAEYSDDDDDDDDEEDDEDETEEETSESKENSSKPENKKKRRK